MFCAVHRRILASVQGACNGAHSYFDHISVRIATASFSRHLGPDSPRASDDRGFLKRDFDDVYVAAENRSVTICCLRRCTRTVTRERASSRSYFPSKNPSRRFFTFEYSFVSSRLIVLQLCKFESRCRGEIAFVFSKYCREVGGVYLVRVDFARSVCSRVDCEVFLDFYNTVCMYPEGRSFAFSFFRSLSLLFFIYILAPYFSHW